MTTNAELSARFEEFADYLDAKDIEYKPRAYRRAADAIKAHPAPLADAVSQGNLDAVHAVEGVGDAIASKIVEYVENGEIEELNELREELPVDMAGLTRVEGVGPKTVGTLYRELEITTLDELEAAANEGRIRTVKGFGEKTEANILENIEFARTIGERQLLGEARPLADDVLAFLETVSAVSKCDVAGSIRRWQATIGDIDVLVGTDDPSTVVNTFLEWESVESEIESGPTKASVRIGEMRVDLRVVDVSEYGAALQYFTGSKDHNVRLRNVAIDRGLKLNEYGAFDVSDVGDEESGQRIGRRVAGETEAGMYEALDLPLIPPELREDRGEIDAASDNSLPELITREDIRGDLHTHTEWSDGRATIEEMAEAAIDLGYDYYSIADHLEGPGVPGGIGISEEELLEEIDAIRAVDDDLPITLLAGVEANIDATGNLDLSDDVIEALDLIIASPHSGLDQGSEEATERLLSAIELPYVDVIGHPSGRLLNEREGLTFDPAILGEAAARHDTALEVNANPRRLDLWGSAVHAAIDAGATIAINTDAHGPTSLEFMRWGVHTARRGWAEPGDVLNSWDFDDLSEFIG